MNWTIANSTNASDLANSIQIGRSASSPPTASSSSCGKLCARFLPVLAHVLRRYRSTTNINLPFRLQTHVTEPTKSRVEYTIHLRANYDSKLSANNVVLKIPTPLNTTNVQSKTGVGKAKYVPGENYIIWKYAVLEFRKPYIC